MTGRPGPLFLVGGFKHELNSFAQGVFSLEDIKRAGYYAEGTDIFEAPRGERPELDAIADIAAAEGLRLLPTVHFWCANAGGPIEHSVYERARSLILDAAREHRDEIAAIMLPLHGATVTTQEEDPEGDLLEALRTIVGPDIPIAATFDTHVHGTARMARHADALVGFKTHPHVDHYDAASQAMRILLATLRGEVRPVTTHRKFRMLTSAEKQNNAAPAYRDLIALSREMEERPGVLAVSIFTTQPWMDMPEIGWSTEVVTDNDPVLGAAVADELARVCWARREEFLVPRTPISVALDHAAAHPDRRPIVFADGSDSTTAGGAGDGTDLLAALVARSDSIDALLTVADAPAVAVCMAAGVGATVDLDPGGTVTPDFGSVHVRGRVIALAEGAMSLDPPWSTTDVGLVALVRVGSVDIVLTERRPWHLNSVIYRHVGRDIKRYQVVQAKSAGGFRAHYAPLAAEIIEIETMGPANSDLTKLPFRRIPRPMWPFDPDLAEPWLPGETTVSTGDPA